MMDIIRGNASDQHNEFAKKHTGITGGIIGLVCVNGKVKSFVQEFPQTLTYESFQDVTREMAIMLPQLCYDRKIVTL